MSPAARAALDACRGLHVAADEIGGGSLRTRPGSLRRPWGRSASESGTGVHCGKSTSESGTGVHWGRSTLGQEYTRTGVH